MRQDAGVVTDAEVVEQQLVLRLRRARTWFGQLARDVHPDIDAAAYGILRLVDNGEATTVTALAERLSVGKPTVSRQVSALEELGLLERLPAEPGSRLVHLRLTDVAASRFAAARARRVEEFRGLLGEWTEQDVATFGALLTKFNALAW